jgi:hypothetical protein
VQGEGVVHRVQQVDAVVVDALDGRPNRDGAGCDDEAVVPAALVPAGRAEQGNRLGGGIDLNRPGVTSQGEAACFDLLAGAVSELAPVGRLPAEVEGDAADAEVRVTVSDDHCHVRGRVGLARPERGADPGVAASDHEQVRHGAEQYRPQRRTAGRPPTENRYRCFRCEVRGNDGTGT